MYQPVIGLEIHVQLKTESKMFCRCEADYFQKEPNSHICPVCFGLPGALPVPNKIAFEKAIKLALALNCKINKNTKFDRKNYFYPDLPKGYQISQFDQPIGFDGFVEIGQSEDTKRIRIQRVHLEEDTAKSHHEGEGETLIDYNKSGVPLAEIVTMPDFKSTQEVLTFAKRLRQIVRYIDASDAEMQKGQMRFELNISVRHSSPGRGNEGEGQTDNDLPNYKIEVKNIGSISVLEKVLNFEIKRQSELLEKGEVIKTQTRGLKDMSGETLFQRYKESSDDYRYFPEPDIPPIVIDNERINELKNELPELPGERMKRYINLGLNFEQADIFTEDIARGNYFDIALQLAAGSEQIAVSLAKWINTDLAGLLLKDNKDFSDIQLKPEELLKLVLLVHEKKINGTVAKSVLEEIYDGSKAVDSIVAERGLLEEVDDSEIENFIQQVIKDNPKVVEDSKKNPNAAKFLVGQVMRLSKGKANAVETEKKINTILGI